VGWDSLWAIIEAEEDTKRKHEENLNQGAENYFNMKPGDFTLKEDPNDPFKLTLVHKDGKMTHEITVAKNKDGKTGFDGIPAFMEKYISTFKQSEI